MELSESQLSRINSATEMYMLILDLGVLAHIKDIVVLKEKWIDGTIRWHVYPMLIYTLPDPGGLFTRLVRETGGDIGKISDKYLKEIDSKEPIFIHGVNLNEPLNQLRGIAYSLFKNKNVNLSDYNICKNTALF